MYGMYIDIQVAYTLIKGAYKPHTSKHIHTHIANYL